MFGALKRGSVTNGTNGAFDLHRGGMIVSVAIEIPAKDMAAFCKRHHIRKFAFFGSVLRDDFTPQSDVDVLVEFEPGHTPGLAFFAMQREMSELLGRSVDLNTAGDLSPQFREQVLGEAEVQYESA
jgi:hypothetical protein